MSLLNANFRGNNFQKKDRNVRRAEMSVNDFFSLKHVWPFGHNFFHVYTIVFLHDIAYMILFIVINSFYSNSFNKNIADIPDHLDRPAMSATFKIYNK